MGTYTHNRTCAIMNTIMRADPESRTGLPSLLPALASSTLLSTKEEKFEASNLVDENKAADDAAAKDVDMSNTEQLSDTGINNDGEGWTLPKTETLALFVLTIGMMFHSINIMKKWRKDVLLDRKKDEDAKTTWWRLKWIFGVYAACVCGLSAMIYNALKHLGLPGPESGPIPDMVCPNVKWDDIGGYDDVKDKLKEMIENPKKFAKVYKTLETTPCKGILLYGPPGCCKTMMAKAVATESKRKFICVKGPQVFDKFVGEAEKKIREIFAHARKNAPSVIFFDEFEVIGYSRDKDSVMAAILTTILTEMDGIDDAGDVIVMAATNRPELLDKAIIRPGRLTRSCYIGLPNKAAREHILRIYLKRQKFTDTEINSLASATDGYTGAEIKNVYEETLSAAIKAWSSNPKNKDKEAEADEISNLVTMAGLRVTLKRIVPQTNKDQIEAYGKYAKSRGDTISGKKEA